MPRRVIARAFKRYRGISKEDDGSLAVEFALVVPLLLIFLFGILDAGLYFYLRNAMTMEVRLVARDLALGNLSATQAQTQLTNNLNYIANLSYTVAATEPDPLDPNDTDVEVSVSLTEEALNSGFSLTGMVPFGDINLEVSMRALE